VTDDLRKRLAYGQRRLDERALDINEIAAVLRRTPARLRANTRRFDELPLAMRRTL